MDDSISRQAAIEIIQSMYPGMPRIPWMRKDWQERYAPFIRTENAIRELPSAQPSYTDEQIQKMQELEQAEIEKAFRLGMEDAQSEIIRCKECKHGMYDMMCKFYWCHGVAHSANWFCADGKRRTDE